MAEDNYQYEPKPLPDWTPIGSDSLEASHSGVVEIGGPSVTPAALDSPFSNPDFTGGGGGGGDLPTCADSRTIGTVRASEVSLPCEGSIQGTLTSAGLQITSGSKTLLIQLDGSANQFFLDQGTQSVRIDPDDLTTDGPDASFRELDVCHMGQPGKRNFLCSEAYAA